MFDLKKQKKNLTLLVGIFPRSHSRPSMHKFQNYRSKTHLIENAVVNFILYKVNISTDFTNEKWFDIFFRYTLEMLCNEVLQKLEFFD
jgi:hypothetical protein